MITRAALPQDNFTIVANDWLRDTRLSWKARGLLAHLISHSVGWSVSERSLTESGPDGRDSVRSGIAELEQYGYLVRTRERGEDGRLLGANYDVREPERLDYPHAPGSDNPPVGFPTEDNPTIRKKNKSSEDQESKKNNPPGGASAVTPIDPPPSVANGIVSAWIDWRGNRPPGSVVGQVAKHVKAMLDEGISRNHIATGITEWDGRELHPSVLPSVVAGVQGRGSRPASKPRPGSATEKASGWLALATQRNAHTTVEQLEINS